VQAGQAGTYYDVLVTNDYGRATSSVAVLELAMAPDVTSQPQSRSNHLGTTATFSVAATGTGPLAYQWRREGTPLVESRTLLGTTTTSLTLLVTEEDAGFYDVVIRSPYAVTTSTVAALTLLVPPSMVQQPLSRTNAIGTTASFWVTAIGTEPLTFQWRANGTPIAGATNATLVFPSVQAGQAGTYYDVLVSNNYGSVTGCVAMLTLIENIPGMSYIPSGPFAMGDSFNEGHTDERPVHVVSVNAYFMDQTEVTKSQWDSVYSWAVGNGYSFNYGAQGKAPNHPAHSATWHDAVKWCNARSEKEGRVPAYYTSANLAQVYRSGQSDIQNDWVRWNEGYRLPTEAEWEKAARGGALQERFTFGNTITHDQANYISSASRVYDVSTTRGYHPLYQYGSQPYTSPVAVMGANRYGLYDMVGNLYEWCWDLYIWDYYTFSPNTEPRGPSGGSSGRTIRGGSWFDYAYNCRSATRYSQAPDIRDYEIGFRAVLAAKVIPPSIFNPRNPPAILNTEEPVDRVIPEGEATTLMVSGTGYPAPCCQWYRNEVALPGATAFLYTIPRMSGAKVGQYYAVLGNVAGSVTSRVAYVNYISKPVVPPIFYALGRGDATEVEIRFSETPDVQTVTNAIYWSLEAADGSATINISNIYPIQGVSTSFVLVAETPRAAGVPYVLRNLENIYGSSLNLLLPADSRTPVATFTNSLIALRNHAWRYDDTGIFPGISWAHGAFNDSGWSNGFAVLDGFRAFPGQAPPLCRAFVSGTLETVYSCLSLSNRQQTAQLPVAYFRTHFQYTGNVVGAVLLLRVLVDDGAVVYLNGSELMRVGMPAGLMTQEALASRTVGNPVWETFALPSGALVTGDNVLAVEVHQDSLTSPDLTFGLELKAISSSPTP
jgi:formylglycine-generating enzyme required for sulfatase activity